MVCFWILCFPDFIPHFIAQLLLVFSKFYNLVGLHLVTETS